MRQNIELSLKAVQRISLNYLGSEDDYDSGHELDELWSNTTELLEQAMKEEELEKLSDEVVPFVEWISQKDPRSDEFRYPETRERDPSLADTNEIDLVSIRKKYLRAEHALSGTYDYLHEQKSTKDEYKRFMGKRS